MDRRRISAMTRDGSWWRGCGGWQPRKAPSGKLVRMSKFSVSFYFVCALVSFCIQQFSCWRNVIWRLLNALWRQTPPAEVHFKLCCQRVEILLPEYHLSLLLFFVFLVVNVKTRSGADWVQKCNVDPLKKRSA